MNNLYVIAIGGSGERILRSLVMTLAAGVDINAAKVVPVIIDNDRTSKALEKCTNLIDAYRGTQNIHGVHSLYDVLGNEKPSFCKTEIAEPIMLNIGGENLNSLKNVINCPSPNGENDPDNSAITSLLSEMKLLFSEKEQTMSIDNGFVAQPHIGTTVLNSKALSLEGFQNVLLANGNDGVIILGSLFGGTGAAGIPLIVNKILQVRTNNTPQIGVVAMLPYFETNRNDDVELERLQNCNARVRPELFDIATRAALMYYDKYMGENIDFMYYIGDDFRPVFKKCDGGNKQDNPALIHELMAAMSVIDFAGKAYKGKTIYKRPAWGFVDKESNEEGSKKYNESRTSGIINKDIRRAIVKFKMMEQVFKHDEIMKQAIETKLDFVEDIGFTKEFLDSITNTNCIKTDALGLNKLIRYFNEWLAELSGKHPSYVRTARVLKIFDNAASVEADKLATAFYSDSKNFGLSKTIEKRKHVFGEKYTEAVSSDILNELQTAYRHLPDRKNINENQILGVTLLYVSKALDNVLENSFNL